MLAWQLNFHDVYGGYLQYRENAGAISKNHYIGIIRNS